MPRGKKLSDVEQGKIDLLIQQGKSQRQIAEEIHRSQKAVFTYISKQDTYNEKHAGGAPKKLTERDERAIGRALSNSTKSLAQIKADLQLNVTRQTIYNAVLGSPIIKREQMKRVPKISPAHEAARMQFAQNHMTTDWSLIIWSDEKKWNLDGPDGFHGYWHDLRKEPEIFSKRNFGGGTLMVWASFRDGEIVGLEFVSSKMDSLEYQKVLEKHLVPYLQQNSIQGLCFMQDNASVHRSNSTMTWLAARNVPVLAWPACSPDLNPLENLWGLLVRDVYKGNKKYATTKELSMAIQKSWKNLDPTILQKLVRSLPDRLYEVGVKHGGPTHY